ARTGARQQLVELVDLEKRHAELRVHAGRADVLVVAPALPRVDTDEHFLALEKLRPVLQGVEIVERDPDVLAERPLVLAARCEVRREQNALAVDARKELEDALDLARRDALEIHAVVVNELENTLVA